MMNTSRCALVCALSFSSATLVAQNTWVVDPSGAGAFTSLAAAQAAASDGDTLILQGAMPGVVLTKRLHLIADGGSVYTNLDILAPGSLSIHGGTFFDVRVAGSTVSMSAVTTSLRVDAGAVVVARGCTFHPGSFALTSARIAAGSRAVFDDCSFRGRDAYALFGVLTSTPAMQVEGRAQLRECTLQGGLEFTGPTLPWLPLHGSPAIELAGSVDLRSCQLDSGGANVPPIWGTGAVYVDNTNLLGSAPVPAGISVVAASLPWMTGDDAPPGGSMQVGVDGPPATLVTISASLDVRSPVPSWLGDIWLEPAYLPVAFGVTDGSGAFGVSLPMPLQVQRGLHVTFQGLVIPNGGGLAAIAPAVLQIR